MSELIAEKIIKLRLYTRRACMCENPDSEAKSTLTLKSKILFLLKTSHASPNEIMSALSIGKTNLAFIARQLESDSLILRTVSVSDRRSVLYEITPKGRDFIEGLIKVIEGRFKNILTTSAEYDAALESLEKVLEMLSFL